MSQASNFKTSSGHPYKFLDSYGADGYDHFSVTVIDGNLQSLLSHSCDNPGEWLPVKVCALSYRAPIPLLQNISWYCNIGPVMVKTAYVAAR